MKKIIEKIYFFIFIKNNGWFLKNLWDFWNKRVTLYFLLRRGGNKHKTEVEMDEVFSEMSDENHILLIELLIDMYGKMYEEMYLICRPELKLKPVVSDDLILKKLWWLQSLCQSEELGDRKSASIFYQLSFRDTVLSLRNFIQNGEAKYLELKLGTDIISEICTIIGVSSKVIILASDCASEKLNHLNKGEIDGALSEKEVKVIWETIYSEDEE